MAFPELITARVGRYERWDPARHTEPFVELCADPAVMRFLGGPMRRRAAGEISERIADHWDVFGFGLWAAVDLATGELAGFTGACKAAWHPRYADDVEVGWRLARWAWGRGLATEGAALSLAPAFAHGSLTEIVSFVHPDNTRSRAVVERLGMRRRGRTTDPRLRHPLEIFVLAEADLASARAARAARSG